MESKTYGLETLARIVAGRTGATDEHGWSDAIHKAMLPSYEIDPDKSRYEVRGGGLWRNSKASPAAVGTPMAEHDVLEWQPIASDKKPALPIPFTAGEFAAFTLAGFGVMVIERFEGIDDEDELNDVELGKLGRNGADAKELLREAHRLRLAAVQRFGINVAKEGEPPTFQLDDASTDEAAAWLLNDAHREKVAPTSKVHRIKRRADPLAAFINQARAIAADPTDWTSVWATMVVLAQRPDRTPPLLGYVDGEGIKYQSENAASPVGWLTRQAWRRRASRAT